MDAKQQQQQQQQQKQTTTRRDDDKFAATTAYLANSTPMAVSMGEHVGSPHCTSWMEIVTSFRKDSGINSRHCASMNLKAALRSASALLAAEAVSGRNMVVTFSVLEKVRFTKTGSQEEGKEE